MQLLWWVLLVAEIALLTWAVVRQRRLRRAGAPLPAYIAGNVWSGVGMVLLIASYLIGFDNAVAIAALVASLVCIALAIRESLIARRNE